MAQALDAHAGESIMKLVLNSQAMAFLQRETHALDRKLLLMTAASGTANALILAVINQGVECLGQGGPTWRLLSLFTLSMAMFAYSLRYTLYQSGQIAEDAIRNIRMRLADKIRRLDLLALEGIGPEEIQGRISRETASIAQTVRPLLNWAQSLLLGIFTLIYITAVSPTAGLLCAAMIGIGSWIHLRNRKSAKEALQKASRYEDNLASSLGGLLKGFKELRINPLKSEDVFQEFATAANRVREVRTYVNRQFSDAAVFLELFFLALLGVVVFMLPVLSISYSSSITKLVASVIFLTGPLYSAFDLIPVLAQINVTVGNLEALEARLDAGLAQSGNDREIATPGAPDFKVIRFEGLGFTYPTQERDSGFQVGPINLELRRGEILFLIGNNGSGKTTLLKLLTALYRPLAGCIRVDGEEIVPANVHAYRNLFSAIFSDFHLFEKLHGLRDTAPERVAELLDLMGISHKTSFCDGAFSNINLSTGQRKRLALVVSYLEDKIVHVFDEVAADQDPEFRAYYYETLLPEMKRAGKTVLVVAHDERYFHIADRIFGMDYGQIRELSRSFEPVMEGCEK